jgi:hypothetical protein
MQAGCDQLMFLIIDRCPRTPDNSQGGFNSNHFDQSVIPFSLYNLLPLKLL